MEFVLWKLLSLYVWLPSPPLTFRNNPRLHYLSLLNGNKGTIYSIGIIIISLLIFIMCNDVSKRWHSVWHRSNVYYTCCGENGIIGALEFQETQFPPGHFISPFTKSPGNVFYLPSNLLTRTSDPNNGWLGGLLHMLFFRGDINNDSMLQLTTY